MVHVSLTDISYGPLFIPSKMEDALKKRVVGQDHVVEAVSDAVRISRAGLQAPNRPVASMLFLGPTGVGKVTSTAALPPLRQF